MLHPRVMMAGEVIDHLVGAEGVPGENDVRITLVFREGEIGVNIFIRVRKALVPGADHLLFPGMHIDGLDPPEGVVGLGIDEIDVAAIQRIADVVIKGVGVEIAVDACDGDHDGVRFALLFGTKQDAV